MSETENPIQPDSPSEPPIAQSTPIENKRKVGRPPKSREDLIRAMRVKTAERARKFLELKIERRRRFANQEFTIQTPQGYRIEGASFEAVVELIAVLGERSSCT